jgi:hypothetical protein
MWVPATYDVPAEEADNLKYQAITFLSTVRVQNKNQYKISPHLKVPSA